MTARHGLGGWPIIAELTRSASAAAAGTERGFGKARPWRSRTVPAELAAQSLPQALDFLPFCLS
jgi:hypothetical protein